MRMPRPLVGWVRPVPSPVCSLFTLCDGDFGSEYKKKKKKKRAMLWNDSKKWIFCITFSFFLFFHFILPPCWNDHWNLFLVEQIRASEWMQHVITITSTEIRFSNFTLQVRKIRNHWKQKSVKSSFKREGSYVPCSFLTPRWTRNSFKNGLTFHDSLVLRHKKTTAELTERVSDFLGGVTQPVRPRKEPSTVEKVS